MSDIYLSSDYHLGHKNIIKYSNRPFVDLEHMNKSIIKNHNEIVKKEDTIFLVGDFCFHNSTGGKNGEGQIMKADEWIKKLNGNIVIIKGNHDKNNGVKSKIERIVIKYANMHIGICHKPTDIIIEDDLFYYPLHFTGHVHEKWLTKEKENKHGKIALCVNIGTDQWNFTPVNIQKLITIYYRWLNKHERKEDILYWNRQSNHRKK